MSKDSISKTKEKSNKITSKDGSICVSTENKTNLSDESKSTGKGAKKTKSGSTKPSGKTPPPKKRGRPPTKKPVEDKAPDDKPEVNSDTKTKTNELNSACKKDLVIKTKHLVDPLVDLSKDLWLGKKIQFLDIVTNALKKQSGIKICDGMKDIDIAGELISNYSEFSDLGVCAETENFYFYEDSRWKQTPVEDLKRTVFKLALVEKWGCSSHKLSSAINDFFSVAEAKPERHAGFIAFQNGVKNVHTREFSHHGKEHGIETYISCNYVANNFHCPVFDATVKTWANHDEKREILIMFALYIHVANRYDLKVYTEVYGASNTGKSIFQKLIELFLGDECCKSSSIKAIETDKHCTAYLYGALSVLIPEAGKNFGTFETLKSIIGDDKISLNKKYGKICDARLRCVIGIFSNEPMVIPEETTAMYERRVLIHFNNPIEKSKQNRNLIEELNSELSAIANKLITYFTPKKVKECEILALSHSDKLNTLIDTDVVYRFITECIIVHKGWTEKQWVQLGCKSGWEEESPEGRRKRARIKVFDCFALFCSADELKTFSRPTFKKRFLMHLKTKFDLHKDADFKPSPKHKNKTIIFGIGIKHADNDLFNIDGHRDQISPDST
jgi:phage/plasmid-associated DNA primase